MGRDITGFHRRESERGLDTSVERVAFHNSGGRKAAGQGGSEAPGNDASLRPNQLFAVSLRYRHQGTVWSWLLGPFALAHFHVNADPAAAQSYPSGGTASPASQLRRVKGGNGQE